MTAAQRAALSMASRLFAYPNEQFWKSEPALRKGLGELGKDGSVQAFVTAATDFLDQLLELGATVAAQEFVATFDHASAASPYLAWHRYGNDRSQGKAMAALNGLYRTAGFEPVEGCLPDYLPRVLEFLAIGPDWAQEALLDGFGPELNGLIVQLQKISSPWAGFLKAAIEPLELTYPDCFRPRSGVDPTIRPMARPEPEIM